MGKRINIKDVANAAGVSVTTTSYALNHIKSARISAETAAHVREVAKQLNYVPSISARTMINHKSNLIGVIIPQTGSSHRLDFKDPFYGEFLSGIEYVTRQNNYHIMVSGTGPNQDYSSIAQMRQLDAIIIIGTYPCGFLDEIKQTGIPVVLVDAYLDDHYFHTITINDRYGGYLATRYLMDKGHRRIAFVSEALREDGVMAQRYRGYQDALAEQGVLLDPALTYSCNISYYDSFLLGQRMARENHGETAIFAPADIVAMGLCNGLTTGGKRVPDDISLIGFDDVQLSTMCLPQLTTIHQPISEKGEKAAALAINAIEGGMKQDVILPLHVVERQSVRDIRE